MVEIHPSAVIHKDAHLDEHVKDRPGDKYCIITIPRPLLRGCGRVFGYSRPRCRVLKSTSLFRM